MSPETDRCVVLGTDTAELRRRLGPTAWVVFEELLLASTGPNEACHASVSVRSLAARLGLAKDTVARALIRLRRVGLVSNCQSRSRGRHIFDRHLSAHDPELDRVRRPLPGHIAHNPTPELPVTPLGFDRFAARAGDRFLIGASQMMTTRLFTTLKDRQVPANCRERTCCG